jgi:hypothetical protein
VTVFEPPTRHTCCPPDHRPKSEWRTVQPPRGWMKPEDWATAKPIPIPTQYSPGTVWVCACGRAWIRRPGQHYGRNPYFRTEGTWGPLPWYAWRIRRRIRDHEQRAAYEEARAIVDSYVLPEPRPAFHGPGTYWVSPPNATVVDGPLPMPPQISGPTTGGGTE